MISGASGRKRVQPNQIEAIEIPLPPLEEQRAIVSEWQQAQQEIEIAQQKANQLVESTDDDLLHQIGLSTLPPTPRRGAFSLRWDELDRWDTFFYRKDFMDLEQQLNSMRHIKLGDALNFISRTWNPSDFPEGEFQYIEISNVTKEEGIIGSKSVTIKNASSRATTLIKEEDIIISTTRPYLGSFTKVPSQYDNCVCSSGFALADSIKISELDQDFVLLFLKSSAGLSQMERQMTGGLYPAIIQSELEKIMIPVPPLETQKAIVKQSNERRTQITQLREQAESHARDIKTEIEARILGRAE